MDPRQCVVVQNNSDECIVNEQRADGFNDPESEVFVQSLSDGCMQSQEGADGSEGGTSVRSELIASSGLLVDAASATSTAKVPLHS